MARRIREQGSPSFRMSRTAVIAGVLSAVVTKGAVAGRGG